MLADGGLSQWRVPDDVVGDAGLVSGQELDDLKAHRVAKRLEHFGQALFFRSKDVRGYCNHIS